MFRSFKLGYFNFFPLYSFGFVCDPLMLRCTCFADIKNLRSFERSDSDSDHNNYIFCFGNEQINCLKCFNGSECSLEYT